MARLRSRWPLVGGVAIALLALLVVPDSWLYDAAMGSDTVVEQVLYACPMHPHVTSFDPSATCPECGMDLEIVRGSNVLTPHDQLMIGLTDTTVRLMPLVQTIRVLGHLEPNDTRVSEIAAYAPGRIETLYAETVGQQLTPGDPLFELYSPQIYVAQQEFLVNARSAAATSGRLRESLDAAVASSRERLALLGMSGPQIEALATSGEARHTLTIRAPRSGTLIARHVREGAYVREGTPIATIADLRSLWLYLDVSERRLPLIRVGQRVRVATESNPGYVGEGWVDFIEPAVDPRSRTARVRVTLSNPVLPPDALPVGLAARDEPREIPANRRYLPGMFATATIEVVLDANLRPALDAAGRPVSITRAEGLPSLPAEAVLVAGERTVVYVRTAATEDGLTFELREVTVGPLMRNGMDATDLTRYRPILAGLREGDVVALGGAFLLDSQAQIRGNPSLYFPIGQGNAEAHALDPDAVRAGSDASPAADPHAGH